MKNNQIYFDSIWAIKIVEQILDIIEFELEVDTKNNIFRVIDLQGGNIGDIEGESFNNLSAVIDRFDYYYQDYFWTPLELRRECTGTKDEIKVGDWDCALVTVLGSDYFCDILCEITPQRYVEIINENMLKYSFYKQFDLLPFKYKDPVIYMAEKIIAHNIIDTESAYHFLDDTEICNTIIFLSEYNTPMSEEEFVERIKEVLKDFTPDTELHKCCRNRDDGAEIYFFPNYTEIINQEYGQIIDDIRDIGLTEDGTWWTFYLSREALEYIGVSQELIEKELKEEGWVS